MRYDITRLLPLYVVVALVTFAHSASTFGQTQREMNQQANADFAKADRRLNAVYASLMAKISATGKDRLRDAQRTWLRFRDQECTFETLGSADGSIHPLVVSQCKSRLTVERIKDLEKQASCEEGDLSCGNQ